MAVTAYKYRLSNHVEYGCCVLQVANDLGEGVQILKLDVDQNSELSTRLQVGHDVYLVACFTGCSDHSSNHATNMHMMPDMPDCSSCTLSTPMRVAAYNRYGQEIHQGPNLQQLLQQQP